jgi:hypothetical protein
LDAVGTPPWPAGFGLEGCFFVFGFDFELLGLELDDCFFLDGCFEELWCCDGFCTFAGARVCGGCEGDLPDVVVVLCDFVVVELGLVEVVDGVVVLLVVGVEVQDSVTPATGPDTGSLIDDRGVFGGTSTVKLTFWPPTRVTVTTHVSAEAVGRPARPNSVSADTADAIATTSFRLLNTMALSPPAKRRAHKPCVAADRRHFKDATDCEIRFQRRTVRDRFVSPGTSRKRRQLREGHPSIPASAKSSRHCSVGGGADVSVLRPEGWS